MHTMSLFPIILLSCCCLQAVSSVSNTFMQLDVLKERAKKISTGNTRSTDKLSNELRVFPELKFTCSGNITGFLLGVEIRNRARFGTSLYPEVHIFRPSAPSSYVNVISQEIRLAAGDFSPDGVLQYNLTTPIPFQRDYILGVYQPSKTDSIVQLYYTPDMSAPDTYKFEEKVDRFTQPDEIVSFESVLISPITDPSECSSIGFFTLKALRQKTLEANINRVRVKNQYQTLFPNITFTCNGSITKWIVGAGTGGGSSNKSELQIWRRTGLDYTKVGSTLLTEENSTSDPNVYEYIPSPPLEFHKGDILGVYTGGRASSVLTYYQDTTGPNNFIKILNQAPSVVITPTVGSSFLYPLVTVETSAADSSTDSTDCDLAPSNSVGVGGGGGGNTATNVLIVMSLISIFGTVIILVFSIILIWWRRNHKQHTQHSVRSSVCVNRVKLQKNMSYKSTVFDVPHKQEASNTYEYVLPREVQDVKLSHNLSCCNSMSLEQTTSSASCSTTTDIEMIENVSYEKKVELHEYSDEDQESNVYSYVHVGARALFDNQLSALPETHHYY